MCNNNGICNCFSGNNWWWIIIRILLLWNSGGSGYGNYSCGNGCGNGCNANG